jgi:hypothetical protein
MIRNKPAAVIGIDTGVKTGLATWVTATRELQRVDKFAIDQAMQIVREYASFYSNDILVRVEDARLANYGRRNDQHRARGAGSVMRDAKIWQDFLTREGIPYEMVRPRKEFTKWKADTFNRFTGWKGRTTSHGRDAAMLVYGY